MACKTNKVFMSVVEADCEEFGGIMDVTYDTELDKCSSKELKKIKSVLENLTKMIDEMIVDKQIDEAYKRGYEDGKILMIDSEEEMLL